MKKFIIVFLFIFTTANIASGKEYKSSYGFSINVPGHWLVLTREELKENPDLFNFENMDSGNIDKNLLKQVQENIRNGNTEIYFNQNTSDEVFSDNINVLKYPGQLPDANQDMGELCNGLKAEFTKYFGRQINIYQCEMKSINNKRALLTEFDGAKSGTTSIQYQLQKSPSVLIVITATSKNNTVDIIRKEFHQMVKSIQFK